ncbi:MAG: hypothetical protein U9N79_07035 [Actinomycetota bacterium]|nr:hypothetical protein [Actinomycetota bacterium]
MKRFAVGFVALALVLTACGSSSESEPEASVGDDIEDATGVDDVEVDLDSIEVSMETDEGTVTGSLSELPDNFADFPMPLPEGFVVETAMNSPGGSAVMVAYPESDFDSIVDEIETWTSSESDEWAVKVQDLEMADGTLMRKTAFVGGEGLFVAGVQDCYSRELVAGRISCRSPFTEQSILACREEAIAQC